MRSQNGYDVTGGDAWFCAASLLWRHNGHDSVSNHQPHDCLLNRLFRRKSKKISKLRVTSLSAGNSPETGKFPAQIASNAENVSIWWRHHVTINMHRGLSWCFIQISLTTFSSQLRWLMYAYSLSLLNSVPMLSNDNKTRRAVYIILTVYLWYCFWLACLHTSHDDVIKWRHFPRYWPFVWGIHRAPVHYPHKASDAELCCFFWSVSE